MDDRKIKYVDLNGLKCFAEELKKYLRDHVLEFSIFNELKDRIEAIENQDFYEVVDSYNDLPEPGKNKIIYLVPENGSFLEYIWKGDAYEQLGSFTPQLSLDKYLKIEDTPFEKGDAENSAVLKGGNNQVISEGGVALGNNNLVGLKAYPFIYIDKTSNAIYLSNENIELVTDAPAINTAFIHPYSVGDTFSIHLGSNFYNCGTITVVNGNRITVDTLPSDLPTSDVEKRYFFYVFAKADKGIIDIGQYSFAHGIDNYAYNEASYAEGKENNAFGKYSHVEGKENDAYWCAHAEGSGNIARGNASHVEGSDNIAANSNSHAEGRYTKSRGYASHAEGYGLSKEDCTESIGKGSHAEGRATKAEGLVSHAEGFYTLATGEGSHAEGNYTHAKGLYSHAEGKGESTTNRNLAEGNYSHVEGEKTKTLGIAAHAEGGSSIAKGNFSHSEGRFTRAHALCSHAEGFSIEGSEDAYGAFGPISHVEGYANKTTSDANSAHAEGRLNTVSGIGAHVEGISNIASREASHAEGQYTQALGKYSHVEGGGEQSSGSIIYTIASGDYSHAEGHITSATGYGAHAEGGYYTKASGKYSHAEGRGTEASGSYSHAEGADTKASGSYSHAEGRGTEASNQYEHAQGKYNKSTKSTYESVGTRFSIGIGTSNENRKNAFEVKANGDIYIVGVGDFTGSNSDSAKSVQEVINELVNIINEITTSETN